MNKKIQISNISKLLQKLRIKPNKLRYYEEALTHKSYMHEKNLTYDYQRLEFLGDSIINKIVACFLFSHRQKEKLLNEGDMTKSKISIVQRKTLARAGKSLHLERYLRLGNGMLDKGLSETIYEDVFEALMAAVYLDQGEKKVCEILHETIIKYYLTDDLKDTIDYKTRFQEVMQMQSSGAAIEYRRIQTKLHNPTCFQVELWCNGIKYGRGEGKKIKEAEINAALDACSKLKGFNPEEW